MRLAPPSMRELLVTDLHEPRRAAQLLEPPRVAHQVTLLLVVEDPLRLGEQGAVHPRRHGTAEVDLGLDRQDVAFAGELAADLRVDIELAASRRRRCASATVRTARPSRTTAARLRGSAGWPSAPAGSCTTPGPSSVEHPTVGERDVDLDVVGVPLVGHRLDPASEAWPSGKPSSQIHAFTDSRMLRVVGLRRPHEPSDSSKPPRQIDRSSLPPSPVAACAPCTSANRVRTSSRSSPNTSGSGWTLSSRSLGVVGPPSPPSPLRTRRSPARRASRRAGRPHRPGRSAWHGSRCRRSDRRAWHRGTRAAASMPVAHCSTLRRPR